MRAAKIILTALACVCYLVAVTHPTPLAIRLLLLAGMVLLGWLFYVRLPQMPTEIDLAEDGWIEFRGGRTPSQVHVASIRSIGRGIGGGTLRVRHGGGGLRMPNRVQDFYEFLGRVKGMNPAIEVRGF